MLVKTYMYKAGDLAPMHDAAVNSDIKLCTDCGKKLGSNPLYFEVNTSWQLIKPDADNHNSQGCFPIGRTCASKFDPALLTKIGA